MLAVKSPKLMGMYHGDYVTIKSHIMTSDLVSVLMSSNCDKLFKSNEQMVGCSLDIACRAAYQAGQCVIVERLVYCAAVLNDFTFNLSFIISACNHCSRSR